ncbi:MAG: hydroxyphenylacetyl-CoA thioesterase PaaI [Betaproteobacteria bacterium]
MTKRAEDIARAIWREDEASKWLGMELEEVRAGYARVAMQVTRHMVNAQKLCHGGLIFSLADSSFGFACNTHNQKTVAASCSIDFLQPAALHDRLTAEATETARAGRSGVYDVRVTNQKGELVALFRGKSATVKGTWIE